MPGWLIQNPNGGEDAAYAVWVADSEAAILVLGKCLKVQPKALRLVRALLDDALERFGAQPGRVARIAMHPVPD